MPEQTSIGFTVSFTDPLGKLNTEEAFHTNKIGHWKSKYNRYHDKYANAAGNYFRVNDNLYEKRDEFSNVGYRLIKSAAYGLNQFNHQGYMIARDQIRELVGGSYLNYNSMFRSTQELWRNYEIFTEDTVNLWRLEYFVGEMTFPFSSNTSTRLNPFWSGLGEYGAGLKNEDIAYYGGGFAGYRSGSTDAKFDYLNLYGYDYRPAYMTGNMLSQILFRQRFAFGSLDVNQASAIRAEATARPDISSLSEGDGHWDLFNGPDEHWSIDGFGTNVQLKIDEIFAVNPGFDPDDPIYDGQFAPIEVSGPAKGVEGTGDPALTANNSKSFFEGDFGDVPFKFFLHEYKGPGTINDVDVPFSDNTTLDASVRPMANSPNEGGTGTGVYDTNNLVNVGGTDFPKTVAHKLFFDTFAPPPIFSREAIPLRTDAVMRDKVQKNDANLRENFQNSSSTKDRDRRISQWMSAASSNPQGYPYLETFVKMPNRVFKGFNNQVVVTKEPVNLITKGYLGQGDGTNDNEPSDVIAFQEDYITRFSEPIIFHGAKPSDRLRDINHSVYKNIDAGTHTQFIDKMEFDFILNPGTIRKKNFNRVQKYKSGGALDFLTSSGTYANVQNGLPDADFFAEGSGGASTRGSGEGAGSSDRQYPADYDDLVGRKNEGRIGSHYNEEDPLIPFYFLLLKGADAANTVNQNGYYTYAGRFNGKPSWAHRRTDGPTGRAARANTKTPSNSNRDHYRIQYDSPAGEHWVLRDYSRNNTDLYTNAADTRSNGIFTEMYRCKNITAPNNPDIPIHEAGTGVGSNQVMITKGKPLTFSWDSTTHTSTSGTIAAGEYTTNGDGGTNVVYTVTAASNDITAITANVSSITDQDDLYFIGEKITVNSGSFSGLEFYVHGVVVEDTNFYHEGWEGVLIEGDNPFGYDLYPDEFGKPATVLAPFMKTRNNIMSAESEYNPDTGGFKSTNATDNAFFQVRIFQQNRDKGLRNFDNTFTEPNVTALAFPVISLFANVATQDGNENIIGNRSRTLTIPLIHVGDISNTNSSTNNQTTRNAGFRTRIISTTGVNNNGGEFLYDLHLKCRVEPREVLQPGTGQNAVLNYSDVRTDVFLVMECSLLDKTTGNVIQTDGIDETSTIEQVLYTTDQGEYFYPEREFFAGRLLLGGGVNPFPGNNFGGSNPAYFKQIKVLKNDEVIHQYDGTAEEARDVRRLVLSNNDAEIDESTNNTIGITVVGGIQDAVGSAIEYRIESVSGNVTIDDFIGLASFNGTFILNDNRTDTLVLRAREDFTTEGDEQLKITIEGGEEQNRRDIFRTITIKDTSKDPEFVLTSEPDYLLSTDTSTQSVESVALRFFGQENQTIPPNAYTNPYNIPTPISNALAVNDIYRKVNASTYSGDTGAFEIVKPSADGAQYLDKLVLKGWGLPKLNLSNLSNYIQATSNMLGIAPILWRFRLLFWEAMYIIGERGTPEARLIFGANRVSNISKTPSGFDLPISDKTIDGANWKIVDLSALYRVPEDRGYSLIHSQVANVVHTGVDAADALLDTGRTYYRVAEDVFRGFPTKTEILQYWSIWAGARTEILNSREFDYFYHNDLNRHSLVQYLQDVIWQIEIENDASKGDSGPRWVINAYETLTDNGYDVYRTAFGGFLGSTDENWRRFATEEYGFDVNQNRAKYRLYQDSQTESVSNRTTPQSVEWEFVYKNDPTSNPFYTDTALNQSGNPGENGIWDINEDTLSQIGTIEVVPSDLTYNRDRWTIREATFPYDTYYEDENNPSVTNLINEIGFNLSDDGRKEYSIRGKFRPYTLAENNEGPVSEDPFSRNYFGYPEDLGKDLFLETRYYPTKEIAALIYDNITYYNQFTPADIFEQDSLELVERPVGQSRNPIGEIKVLDFITADPLVGIHESPQDSPDSPNALPRNTFKVKLRTKHVPHGTVVPFRILGFSDGSPPVLGGSKITNLDFDVTGQQVTGTSQVLLRGFGDTEPFNSSPNHGLGDSPVINPNGLYTLLSNNPSRFTKVDSYRNITVNGVPIKSPRGFVGRVSSIPNNAEVKYTEWTFRQENSDSPRHLLLGETFTKNLPERQNHEDPSRYIRRITAYPGDAFRRLAPYVELYVGDSDRNELFISNEDREQYPNYAALNSPSWTLSQGAVKSHAAPFLSSAQQPTRRDANIFRFDGQVQETTASKRAFSDRTIVQWEQREVVSTASYTETYTKRYGIFFRKKKTRTIYVPKEIRVRLFHRGNAELRNLQVGDNVKFYYYDKINSVTNTPGSQKGAVYGTEIGIDSVTGRYTNISSSRWYGLGGNAYRDYFKGLQLDEIEDEWEVTNVSRGGNWFEVIINIYDTIIGEYGSINSLEIFPHVGFFAYTSTETQPDTVVKRSLYNRNYKVTAADPRETDLLVLEADNPQFWPNLIAPAGFTLSKFNEDLTYDGFEDNTFILLNSGESNTGTWSDGSARLITFEDIIDDNTPDSAVVYYKTSDSPSFTTLSDAVFEVVEPDTSPAGIAIARPLSRNESEEEGTSVSGAFTIIEDSPGIDIDRNGGAELDFTVRDDNNIIEGDEVLQFELQDQLCNSIRFKLINNQNLDIPVFNENTRSIELDMVFTGDNIDIEQSYVTETLEEGISFNVINATLIRSDSANGEPLNSPNGLYNPNVNAYIQSNPEDGENPFTFRITGSYGLESFPRVTYRAREFESIEETRLKFKNGTKFNNGDIAYRKNPIQQDSPAFLTNLYGRADSPNFVLSQDVLANRKYNSPSPIRIASRVVSDSSPVVFDSPGESYKVDDIITEVEGFGWPPPTDFPVDKLYSFKPDPKTLERFKYHVVWQLEKTDLTVNPPIFEIVLDLVEYNLPVGNQTETVLSKSLAAYVGG